MQKSLDCLNKEELLELQLRELYSAAGYTRYSVGKFEECELYLRNKSFLSDSHVISFTDLDGRLLALKPDVTLSVVRNVATGRTGIQKLFYNERVYRVAKGKFKEIVQTGVEALGAVDIFTMLEVAGLAVESLRKISDSYVLELSHVGFVYSMIESAGITDEAGRRRVLVAVSQKNMNELQALCAEYDIRGKQLDMLTQLISVGGDVCECVDKLRAYAVTAEQTEALAELYAIGRGLVGCGNVKLDFSIDSDAKYYNGLLLRGYVDGVPDVVLSGGRYDKLLARLSKKGGAIGFAVYISALAEYYRQNAAGGVDIVLRYTADDNAVDVYKQAIALRATGSVYVTDCTDYIKCDKEYVMSQGVAVEVKA